MIDLDADEIRGKCGKGKRLMREMIWMDDQVEMDECKTRSKDWYFSPFTQSLIFKQPSSSHLQYLGIDDHSTARDNQGNKA
jgi:hypothetical protein